MRRRELAQTLILLAAYLRDIRGGLLDAFLVFAMLATLVAAAVPGCLEHVTYFGEQLWGVQP